MKNINWIYLAKITFLVFLLQIITACKKEQVPTVKTNSVSEVAIDGALCGGTVLKDGGARVTSRGVCWSLSPNPTKSLETKTFEGSGLGSFTSTLYGLDFGKTYHVRAFATNSVGTAYGEDVTFTTKEVFAPGVITSDVMNKSSHAVIIGGTVTSDGGGYVTAGITWSKGPDPILETSSRTDNFYSIGPFTSTIFDLEANTTYYFKAYANNQAGTVYGDQNQFTSLPGIVDNEGNKYGIVVIGTQTWLSENLTSTKLNNGDPIPLVSEQSQWNNLSTPGYCWYNNTEPGEGSNSGALYNWHTINTGKLCPAGWHVPTDGEWTTLIEFLGGESTAGNRLFKYGGSSDNSLFSAEIFGIRDTIIGFPEPQGCGGLDYTRWWSASSDKPSTAWCRYLSSGYQIFRASYSKKYGFSVRCIKD